MNSSEGNKRLRFTYEDDVWLLKEVSGRNPLACPDNWNKIQENLSNITGKNFTIRTLKDHLFLILNLWKKKNEVDQERPVVEKVYTEKDLLLQEVADMCADLVPRSKKKKGISKEKQLIQLGRTMRDDDSTQFLLDESMDNKIIIVGQDHSYDIELVNESEVIDNAVTEEEVPEQIIAEVPSSSSTAQGTKRTMPPAPSRPNRNVLFREKRLEYLNNKSERELDLKAKELVIEDKKIALEYKRLELEERKMQIQEKKWEIELNEMKLKRELDLEHIKIQLSQSNTTIALIESQAKVIDTLIRRLEVYEN